MPFLEGAVTLFALGRRVVFGKFPDSSKLEMKMIGDYSEKLELENCIFSVLLFTFICGDDSGRLDA